MNMTFVNLNDSKGLNVNFCSSAFESTALIMSFLTAVDLLWIEFHAILIVPITPHFILLFAVFSSDTQGGHTGSPQ